MGINNQQSNSSIYRTALFTLSRSARVGTNSGMGVFCNQTSKMSSDSNKQHLTQEEKEQGKRLTRDPHSGEVVKENKYGQGVSHATGDSIVPEAIQKLAPEALERALPDAIHDTSGLPPKGSNNNNTGKQ